MLDILHKFTTAYYQLPTYCSGLVLLTLLHVSCRVLLLHVQ
jgi:hypothetical protein